MGKQEIKAAQDQIKAAGYKIPEKGPGSRSLVRAWLRDTFRSEYSRLQESQARQQEMVSNNNTQPLRGEIPLNLDLDQEVVRQQGICVAKILAARNGNQEPSNSQS